MGNNKADTRGGALMRLPRISDPWPPSPGKGGTFVAAMAMRHHRYFFLVPDPVRMI